MIFEKIINSFKVIVVRDFSKAISMQGTQSTRFCRSGKLFVQGFTLVEAMMVVTILGILAALAVPSFKSIIDSSRRTAYANQLFEDFAFARSEAIKRGVRVTVCPSTDGSSCRGTSGWEQGWITFVDLNRDGARATTEELLKVHESLPSGWTAVKNNDFFVGFGPLGTPNGVINFTLAVCNTTPACTPNTTSKQTNLVVSLVGRVKMENFP